MKPGDLIRFGNRFWEVATCAYGALGCESVIGMRVIGLRMGCNDDGKNLDQTYVPTALLQAAFRGGAIHYEQASETAMCVEAPATPEDRHG